MMRAPLLLDLSHTSHTRARTGIQRVARSLHDALGARAVAVTHDPHLGAWRSLEAWESANLRADAAAAKRGAQWPLGARLRSRTRRAFSRSSRALPENAGLLVPEVFSPAVARALPEVFAQTRGPRVAIFHDAIALQFPELSPPKTVARFPPYLLELLEFDGIAAVSDQSRDSLLAYWQWIGATETPPVRTIALGVEIAADASERKSDALRHAGPRAARGSGKLPVILSIGSIEGRKNHLALLEACEALWSRGLRFELHLIGLAQPQTGAAALARTRALQAANRPLRYDGPVSDAALTRAYAECEFTVYPSLIEGFGLPVLESLAHGRPCVCSARGALGEAAREGGCVALESVAAVPLAAAIERLLAAPAEVERLAVAARARKFKSWKNYADELAGWMSTLPRR